MFCYRAWAVGGYSCGRLAARTVGTKSTGGFYRPDLSPCFYTTWKTCDPSSVLVQEILYRAAEPPVPRRARPARGAGDSLHRVLPTGDAAGPRRPVLLLPAADAAGPDGDGRRRSGRLRAADAASADAAASHLRPDRHAHQHFQPGDGRAGPRRASSHLRGTSPTWYVMCT